MNKDGRWCWTLDDECWPAGADAATREECIADAIKKANEEAEENGDTSDRVVHLGRVARISWKSAALSALGDCDTLLESMEEWIYESEAYYEDGVFDDFEKADREALAEQLAAVAETFIAAKSKKWRVEPERDAALTFENGTYRADTSHPPSSKNPL